MKKRKSAIVPAFLLAGGVAAGVAVVPSLVGCGPPLEHTVANIGFDWERTDQVVDKLHEELNELTEARKGGSRGEVENEIGDILFALVNVARHLKVDPEQALRKSNAKFRRRFAHVENNARLPGASLDELTQLIVAELMRELCRS